jgi:hypothetical protein
MAYIPLNKPAQPGDPVGSVYIGGPKNIKKVIKTPKPVIPKTIGPVNKTQIDKAMTYEMNPTRKADLKKMYNSNPTLQKKFKTFETYLQQFMQPSKK